MEADKENHFKLHLNKLFERCIRYLALENNFS